MDPFLFFSLARLLLQSLLSSVLCVLSCTLLIFSLLASCIPHAYSVASSSKLTKLTKPTNATSSQPPSSDRTTATSQRRIPQTRQSQKQNYLHTELTPRKTWNPPTTSCPAPARAAQHVASSGPCPTRTQSSREALESMDQGRARARQRARHRARSNFQNGGEVSASSHPTRVTNVAKSVSSAMEDDHVAAAGNNVISNVFTSCLCASQRRICAAKSRVCAGDSATVTWFSTPSAGQKYGRTCYSDCTTARPLTTSPTGSTPARLACRPLNHQHSSQRRLCPARCCLSITKHSQAPTRTQIPARP